jgi:hypothetical protein
MSRFMRPPPSSRSVMKKLTIHAMVSLAHGRGGRCISSLYVNSTSPLLWQCAAGHQWRAVPASIRKGSWCPACAGVKRRTICDMRELAEFHGGSCLSEKYVNTTEKLSWRCSAGHEWSAAPFHIKRGHWCPLCARVARLTLQEMQRIAAGRFGQCLSTEYVGSSRPLKWRCAGGHEWEARPASIKSGNWCPFCARNRKLELEEMREIALRRGGRCLSKAYKNGRTPLLWECKRRHHWKARPASIKSGARRKGSWCPACYNSRRVFRPKESIQTMRTLAAAREGRCLSTEYIGSKTKLIWQCAHDHRWEASPVTVVQGTWCPVCAHNQRLSLAVLQGIAASRGGNCLSQAYVNERTPLSWYCAAGHRWDATPGKVKRGSWCAKCASMRRRSKWTITPTNEPNDAKRPAVNKRSQRRRLLVGTGIETQIRRFAHLSNHNAGIKTTLRSLKQSPREALRNAVPRPRKQKSGLKHE